MGMGQQIGSGKGFTFVVGDVAVLFSPFFFFLKDDLFIRKRAEDTSYPKKATNESTIGHKLKNSSRGRPRNKRAQIRPKWEHLLGGLSQATTKQRQLG